MRNAIRYLPITLLVVGCASQPSPVTTDGHWYLQPLSVYDSGYRLGTEIVSVQDSSLRAVLNNFETGEVDVLDLAQPEKIKRLNRFSLGLSKGEELTSVAFHPAMNAFAAVIDASNQRGRLEIRSASDGTVLDHVEVGFGPDAVVFSKDGSMVLVANEGEEFSYDRNSGEFFSAEGSISIIHLDSHGRVKANNTLELANVKHREGFTIQEQGHYLEREIDWDGDGKIAKKIDFDGNGVIENKKVKIGRFEGADVLANESKGEAKILIPVASDSMTLLEPEYIALSKDSKTAYVTLQETNEVAVVDVVNGRVQGYFNMGVAQHQADRRPDGWVRFDQAVLALREPDGIALTPDGKYFLTADEGDTDTVVVGGEEPLQSGGRTVSVFDAQTGDFVADTGNQLDEITFANHVYPDRRSNKKGAEPEMLVTFEMEGQPWVVVGMERADSVVLIALNDPTQPKVVALGKIPGEENPSPEGIAHFEHNGKHYILTANETIGTVACFELVRNPIKLEH